MTILQTIGVLMIPIFILYGVTIHMLIKDRKALNKQKVKL